jgi:RNA polymerase sigma factor (sigma-70 family)
LPDSPGQGHAAAGAGTAPLTAAIARGDAGAMGAFYEAWFDRAYAAARALTRRDESFCLDVVQEAMLRAARRMRPLATEEDVARWMSRVVRTAALDLLRRESRRAARERVAATDGRAGGQDAEARERVEWVRARLVELPAEEAGLLRLRFWEDRTLDEAGRRTGMTGHAVHGRIRRVLSRLRLLAREWTDERG